MSWLAYLLDSDNYLNWFGLVVPVQVPSQPLISRPLSSKCQVLKGFLRHRTMFNLNVAAP